MRELGRTPLLLGMLSVAMGQASSQERQAYEQSSLASPPSQKVFVDSCLRMHFLRREPKGAIAFQHLKLRDICALPKLFEQSVLVKPDASAESTAWGNPWQSNNHALQRAALGALAQIGSAGVDMVNAYRRVSATSTTEKSQRPRSTIVLFLANSCPEVTTA